MTAGRFRASTERMQMRKALAVVAENERRDRLATIPSYDVSRLSERILALTTQRENLRQCLEDVEADPAFGKLVARLRQRIADLLEST